MLEERHICGEKKYVFEAVGRETPGKRDGRAKMNRQTKNSGESRYVEGRMEYAGQGVPYKRRITA